jgi:hypothetical protein
MGDAYVQYADALAMKVTNHEISEGEARERFAQYKTQLLIDARRNAAIIAGGIAAGASHPMTCNTIGNTTNCF